MKWNLLVKIILCLSIILAITGLYGHLFEMRIHLMNKTETVEFHKGNEQAVDKIKHVLLSKSAVEAVAETPNPKQLRRSNPVIVYNISKVKENNVSLCVKSRTPSVFIICTWELDKDKIISGNIQRKGQWEPLITKKIYDILNQRRDISFVDIGANIGYFSLLAAAVGQPVVAVEPWIEHINKLAQSIQINKFKDRITLINNAVSDERHTVHINFTQPTNKGAARLISEQENVFKSDGFNVTSIIINDLIDFISTKDVAIKIDIEGHECRAFEKADELFNKFNVLFISMEWNVMQVFKNMHGVACRAENIQKMVDMLTNRGFEPYSFKNNQKIDLNKQEKYIDIYWMPKSLLN